MSRPGLSTRRQADFKILFLFCWAIAFVASGWFVTNYENVMNRTDLSDAQRYTGAGTVGQIAGGGAVAHTTNLLNEGVIGYAGLSLVGFSAFMFIREVFGLQKFLFTVRAEEVKPWNRSKIATVKLSSRRFHCTQITPGGKREAGVNT